MKYLALTIFLLIISSCEQLNIKQNADLVVVEGYLSDQKENQTVLITRTASFENPNNSIPIISAQVRVISSKNETFQFKHSMEGLYIAENTFNGEQSTEYQLVITLENGTNITSSELIMPSSAHLDSLWFESLTLEETDEEEVIYFPIIASQDDLESEDFFYYKLFQNGAYLNDPAFIFLKEDVFFNGNSFKEEFRSIALVLNDSISVEIRKVNKEIFEYYSLLKEQTISISANQNIVPAPIYGNLSASDNQTVLGFFSVFASARLGKTVNP